jgi:hypothetical protein
MTSESTSKNEQLTRVSTTQGADPLPRYGKRSERR